MENDNSVLGLASIRRNRRVSLEQIAECTKISVRFLRAIESGEFQKLPGGIYNTSYIRQYARAIDFNEVDLLAYYNAQMGLSPSRAEEEHNGTGFGNFRPSTVAGS